MVFACFSLELVTLNSSYRLSNQGNTHTNKLKVFFQGGWAVCDKSRTVLVKRSSVIDSREIPESCFIGH